MMTEDQAVDIKTRTDSAIRATEEALRVASLHSHPADYTVRDSLDEALRELRRVSAECQRVINP